MRQSLILFADVPFAKADLHPMSLRAETWIIAIIAMNHRHNHNGTQIRNFREGVDVKSRLLNDRNEACSDFLDLVAAVF